MSDDEFSRRMLEKQREFDAALHAALQVPAPDGLADRILVARGLQPARRRWPYALAASLVLAVGVAILWPRLASVDPLGREAITHVAHEPQSFTTAHAVPAEFLPAMLSNQGAKLAFAVGQVTYARLCPMAGRVAHHIVVRTAAGPVTLFLLADDPQATRKRAVTERDGMAAVVLPAAKGSITIVANNLAQALEVEKSLRI